MNQKKLFLIITKSQWGGATRYVYDLATNLPKDQFDITVVFGESGLLQDKLAMVGIKTISIPYLQRDIAVWQDLKTFVFLLKLFYRERPDIIHLNSSKIGGIGAVAGRLAGIKKIIFTGHGWAFNENRPWWQKKIILFLHWLTIILNHYTITVAESIKQQVQSLPFIDHKLVTIHNGIAPFSLLPKAEAREIISSQINYQLTETDTIIGSISELHPNKGLDLSIKSFKNIVLDHPQLKYIIIGSGQEKNNLTKLINDLDLKNNVYLAGPIDDAKTLLSAFDLFLLPSRTEAFPYVILEAMSANLPIVASNVGGIKEVIKENDLHRLVPPANIPLLTETITNILPLINRSEINTKYKVDDSLTTMITETTNLYK